MSQVLIGVCIFDDPKSARDGWASIAGQKGTRITGYHELSSDKLWVTNLDFPDFKALNLLRLKHLAQSQYFRTSIKMLQSEYGILEAKELSEFLSRMFNRVARLGDLHLGVEAHKFNYRYTQAVGARLDVPALRIPIQGLNPNEVQLIVDHATQENQAMTGVKKPERSQAVAFIYPRFSYAKWLLTQDYPLESVWKKDKIAPEYRIGIKEGRAFTKANHQFTRMMDNYINNARRSVFLRIAVMGQEPSHRSFATFGAGAKGQRVWASYHEVLELMRYAEVAVYDSVSVGSGKLKDIPMIDTPEYSNSVSAGLFLENLYCSLMAPVDKTNTALGAYMRSLDRMACGRAAEQFHNAGFVVGSYSSGRIIVLVREGERDRAAQLAIKIGLIPPFEPDTGEDE